MINLEELIEHLKDKLELELEFSNNTLEVKLVMTINKELKGGYGFIPEKIEIASDYVDLTDLEPGTNFI